MNAYHLRYEDFQWLLHREVSRAPLAVFDVKQDAVEFSKLYARHYHGVLIIEDPDHDIEEQRDYSENARRPNVTLVFATIR
ncbi:MAG TPA: DUF2188 domain-containing protein [Verrucomicrobiaceae bacterium]|jgi:hypothetical protein